MSNRQYIFEKKENETNQDALHAKLVYITSAKYETDWHSVVHSHPFTELFYVVSGQGVFHIENEIFDVKTDDLVIVNPNVSHTETSKLDSPMEYIVLGVEGLSLLTTEYEHSTFYSLHHFQEQKKEILFYLRMLLSEIIHKKMMHELIIQNLLEVFLATIIRHTQTKLKLSSSKEMNNHCTYLKAYIDEHFKEDISLKDLCNISYMNKFYMIHNFKKQLGITPIAYLNLKRLEESCSLLENTNLSVSRIANAVGMSSATYFTQAFKKQYNCPPLEWRKRAKEKKE